MCENQKGGIEHLKNKTIQRLKATEYIQIAVQHSRSTFNLTKDMLASNIY